MRTRMLAAVSLILAACAGSENPPTLSITPSGMQAVSGPVTVTASPPSLTNDLTWSLSGPGTISGTKGISVVYRPAVPANPPQPATVTVTAGSQTASVTFTSQTPQQPSHAIAGLTGNVDVTYDQYDIPHIFCSSKNDCYAVQGYIQALTNGVNAYIAFLKQNVTLLPQEYAQFPGPPTPNDIPDWALEDTLAI